MQLSDGQISSRLISFLRASLQRPALAYRAGLTRITGGFETSIFGFQLDGAPDEFSRPLILRAFREFHEPERARSETAVQNALAGMGYPAPRVLMTVANKDVLATTFVIMERMPGRTVMEGFEGLGRGRGLGQLFGLLIRAPQLIREVTNVLVEAQARLHELPVEPLIRALNAEGIAAERVTVRGRLEWIGSLAQQAAFAGLKPGMNWLLARQPPEPERTVICHNDIQPFNVLLENGSISGVIDWGNTMIADPAVEVGSTVASIVTVPLEMPRPFVSLGRMVQRVLARRYYEAYTRLRPLDRMTVGYYEVFRCVGELFWVADAMLHGRTGVGAFEAARGIDNLIAHARKVAGVQLRFPVATRGASLAEENSLYSIRD